MIIPHWGLDVDNVSLVPSIDLYFWVEGFFKLILRLGKLGHSPVIREF